MPPWDPEFELTPSHAARLINSQFPNLAPATLRHLGTGWDNAAYAVNERHVFRFPHRQLGAELIAVEQRVTPRIHERLPLPISHTTHLGAPADGYPWPFTGHPFIPGRMADTDPPPDDARTRCAEPLARFLRALHAITRDEARTLGATDDTIGRLDLRKRVPGGHERLDRLEALDVSNTGPCREAIDRVDGLVNPRPTCLVHGDLYQRHLLLDAEQKLAGVIDWGDVHIGNPAADLMIAHLFLPHDAHPVFRQAYGPIDEDTWAIARFRAVVHAAALIEYAHDIGDESLRNEYMRSLRNASAD